MERWDEFTIQTLSAGLWPVERLGNVLLPRKDMVDRKISEFNTLQPISIHFDGSVSKRVVAEGISYKLKMLRAEPGDIVLSKIDLKNGALTVLPDWPNAVVTTHFKVYEAHSERLFARFLQRLMQTKPIKTWLWQNRSGADGRTEVKIEVFENLAIPLPPLLEQQCLITALEAAQQSATDLQRRATTLRADAQTAFEAALGFAPELSLPKRPVFVARYAQLERWSHEGLLRAERGAQRDSSSFWPLLPAANFVTEARHGCSAGPAKIETGLKVLKISAVTKGRLRLSEYKPIEDRAGYRADFGLKAGDVLLCRTNGTLAYVGMTAHVSDDVADTIIPDKIIRVRLDGSMIDAWYFAEVLKTPRLRASIEAAARTAVGNFAIGAKDIRALMIPLPPLSTQRDLVQALQAARDQADALSAQAATLLSQAAEAFEQAVFGVSNSP